MLGSRFTLIVLVVVALGVMVFVLPACESEDTPGEPSLMKSNPYEYTDAELGEARDLLAAHQSILILLATQTNPYGFVDADTTYAMEQNVAATARRNQLQYIVNSRDFRTIGSFYMSPEDTRAGIQYWQEEYIRVWDNDLPYWEGQLAISQQDTIEVWTAFCTHMVANVELNIERITAIVDRLQIDEMVLDDSVAYDERIDEFAAAKLQVENQNVDYFSDLIDVLIEGLTLTFLHWSDIEDLLVPRAEAAAQLDVWISERDSMLAVRYDYWNAQGAVATGISNVEWWLFCKHMIEHLALYEDFINATIDNLTSDLCFADETVTETLLEVINRKGVYYNVGLEYFKDLSTVLHEGTSLTIMADESSVLQQRPR